MRHDAWLGHGRCPAGALFTGGVTVAAACGWWRARRALRPVKAMVSELERMGVTRLDRRVGSSHGAMADLAAALNVLLDRLEHDIAQRRWLLAETAHEVRRPLTAMKAELEVSLRADDLDAPAHELIQGARDQVDRMAQTLEDALRLAQGEGDVLVLAPVDLGQAAGAAARQLLPLARAKGVTLDVGDGSGEARADPRRLHQALTNLIENAIKFSPAGGAVSVSAWQREGRVGVTVADEGPGVPHDARERVFEPFYRIDGDPADSVPGSGLGLAISRQIAVAHGGRVWVDGGGGGGSAFSLELPSAHTTNDEDDGPPLGATSRTV